MPLMLFQSFLQIINYLLRVQGEREKSEKVLKGDFCFVSF